MFNIRSRLEEPLLELKLAQPYETNTIDKCRALTQAHFKMVILTHLLIMDEFLQASPQSPPTQELQRRFLLFQLFPPRDFVGELCFRLLEVDPEDVRRVQR